jgi:hypothetical protein
MWVAGPTDIHLGEQCTTQFAAVWPRQGGRVGTHSDLGSFKLRPRGIAAVTGRRVMLGTRGTVAHSGLNSRHGRLALRAGVVGMALIFLPIASLACNISVSTQKIVNSTQQEVTVRAIKTDDLGCFMNTIDLTYTKPDGTAGSMSDTIGAAGTVTFKITAKAGTNINAQNVTETPNTFDKTKAVAFNPPMNRVESVYLVNAGSSVTFGGNTFNVSGGYTVIDTNIDYSTGAETGHLAAVDIDASGPAGTVLFTLSGTPAFDVNLSPI